MYTYCLFCFVEIEDGHENEEEEGTYFVDQAGHYYFQAKGSSQPVMTMVSGLTDASAEESEEYIINPEAEEAEAEEEEAIREQPDNDNQILINNGNAYQRITVVPSENNPNELSYVLIVQNPDDLKEGMYNSIIRQ